MASDKETILINQTTEKKSKKSIGVATSAAPSSSSYVPIPMERAFFWR
jgi:hypothetical protein